MPITRAIVLSHEVFGEADRYIQFLTRDWGVISVLAKSARKSKRRYVGGLDLFCHDEINVRGDLSNKGYLIDLLVINSFTELRGDLDKMLLAGRLVQWVRQLSNISTPIPQIYSLLGQTLAVLESQTHSPRFELLGLIFRLKLLAYLGFHPRTESCARCDRKSMLRMFDCASGGLLCPECKPTSDHWELENEECAFMTAAKDALLTRFDDVVFSERSASRLIHLTTRFASYHTHLRLPV